MRRLTLQSSISVTSTCSSIARDHPARRQLRDVFHRVSTAALPADEVDAYMASVLAAVREGKTFGKITKCRMGRSFPLQPADPDGGWVATHEDITERLLAEEKSGTWRITIAHRLPTAQLL